MLFCLEPKEPKVQDFLTVFSSFTKKQVSLRNPSLIVF